MNKIANLSRYLAILLFCCVQVSRANASPLTFTGSFTEDDTVFSYNFTIASSQVFSFYTTSYGGGGNLVGPPSPAGGFDPVLTLFSTTTGDVLGFGGGAGVCEASSNNDPKTGLCEDASFSELLGPGSYTWT